MFATENYKAGREVTRKFAEKEVINGLKNGYNAVILDVVNLNREVVRQILVRGNRVNRIKD